MRSPGRPLGGGLLQLVALLLSMASPTVARSLPYFDIKGAPGVAVDVTIPRPPAMATDESLLVFPCLTYFLHNGMTSTTPMANWDTVTVRTFVANLVTPIAVYITLAKLDDGSVFHLELQQDPPHTKAFNVVTGDFNGDGVPDVAIGWIGWVEIFYLRDDKVDPILARRAFHAKDAGVDDFVPFQSFDDAFTLWPHYLIVVKDLDNNGCDELFAGRIQLTGADGGFREHGWTGAIMGGTDLMFLQDANSAAGGEADGAAAAAAPSPLLYAAHLDGARVFPDKGLGEPAFGSCSRHLGDVDGDGVDDLALLTYWDCDLIDIHIMYLRGGNDYAHPVKGVSRVGLDEATRYWLRGCRRPDGPPVRVGQRASTAPDLQLPPILRTKGINVEIHPLGDLNGDGLPELLLHQTNYNWVELDVQQKNLIVSARTANLSETRLLGAFAEPKLLERASQWTVRRQPLRAFAGGGDKAGEEAGGVRMVRSQYLLTGDLVITTIALPAFIDALPMGVYHEPDLVTFEQPWYELWELLNIVVSGLGFVCAVLIVRRLRQPRKAVAGGLSSLMNTTCRWLFICNAAYAGAFLVFALTSTIYLHATGLVRSYGLNENGIDPQLLRLKRWVEVNQRAVFWLEQLSLLPAAWHIVLAYIFHAFLVRGRSPAVLERRVQANIWWQVLVAVAVIATVEAAFFFGQRHHALEDVQVIVHITLNLGCLLTVTVLYVWTLVAWVSRYGVGPAPLQQEQQQQFKGHAARPHRQQNKTLWRLVVILACFIVTWGLMLANDIVAERARWHGRKQITGDVPSTFMTVVDAVILGNALSLCWRCRGWFSASSAPPMGETSGDDTEAAAAAGHGRGRPSHHHHHHHRRRGGRRSSGASVSLPGGLVLGPRRARSSGSGRLRRSLRVFVSTYNAGGANKERDVGPLEAWIPLGFELYVIGLQECALLKELRRGIHRRLGGGAQYTIYENHVWSPKGEIALLLFARARDVASGTFEVLGGLFSTVNLGVNVGVGRLANKAAVGLACRLYDRTIACVAVHFQADSKGRERPEARVADAVRSLKSLSLGCESEEVDLQLAFHHVILFGDLNFRVRLPPERVVQELAQSVAAERKVLARVASCHSAASIPSLAAAAAASFASSATSLPLPSAVSMSRRRASSPSTSSLAGSRAGSSKADAPTWDRHAGPHDPSEGSSASLSMVASMGTAVTAGGGSGGSNVGSLSRAGSARGLTSWRLSRYRGHVPELPAPGPFGSQPTCFSRSNSSSTYVSGGSAMHGAAAAAAAAGGGGGGGGAGAESAPHVVVPLPLEGVAKEDEGMPPGAASGASRSDSGADGRPDKDNERGRRLRFAESTVVVRHASDDEEAPSPSPSPSPPPPPQQQGEESAYEDAYGEGEGGDSDSDCDSDSDEEDELARCWRWVRQHDELSCIMRDGLALHGFREGRLCFPPSFRWIKGARADYGKEGAAAFDGCYTLRKKSEGAKGLRPPSYTDRVLVHSLPDLAGDVAIDEYDICDAITGSDHRPVAAALRLALDEQQARLYNASALAPAPAMDHGVSITLSEVRYLPVKATLRARLRKLVSFQWATTHLGSSHHGGLGLGGGHGGSDHGGGRGGGFGLPGRSRSSGSGSGAGSSLGEVCKALIIHYPLNMEQPQALLDQRKAHEMEAGFGLVGGPDPEPPVLGKAATSQSWAPSRLNGTVHELAVAPAEEEVEDPLYRVKTSVCGMPLYAVIRLKARRPSGGERKGSVVSRIGGVIRIGGMLHMGSVSRVGGAQQQQQQQRQGESGGGEGGADELGQGVLCLREVLLQQQEDEEEQQGEGGGDGIPRKIRGVPTRVDVCRGGNLVGTLEARVHVAVRQLN